MRTIGGARGWDFAAAAIAGGLTASELVRVAILGIGSNAQTALLDIIDSAAFVAVLAVAAIGMAVHRQVGWMFGVLGFLIAAAYGVILSVSGSAIGAVYIFSAMALFACVVKSLHGYRRNEIVAA